MPALLTETDRQIYRLQCEIQQQRRWLHDESGDRRAVAFHRATIAELEAELDRLEDSQ